MSVRPDLNFPRVIGRGAACRPCRERASRPGAGLVRYADPAAWIVTAAVAEALDSVGALPTTLADEVGVITVSIEGPRQTMVDVAEGSQQGLASPLRFAAANPGSLAGLACSVFGFRGPSLNLTMPVARGALVAMELAACWLGRRRPAAVVIAVHSSFCGQPLARCLVLAGPDLPVPIPPLELDVAVRWLSSPFEELTPEIHT